MATSMNYSLDVIARVLKKWEAAYKNCQCTDTPDIQKLVKEALFESDVTKFKVTATDTYKEENFGIRSTVRKCHNDVVVDWGDGNKTVIKDSDIEEYMGQWESDGEVAFHCKHTYEKPGDYDVTIYGKDYFGVSRKPEYIGIPGPITDLSIYNTLHHLISECFNEKYPIASCVNNLSWFAACSEMLTEVNIPTGFTFQKIDNISLIFKDCRNLKKVTGMKYKFFNTKSKCLLFQNCQKLQECDYIIGATNQYGDALHGPFNNCKKLVKDIKSFFPRAGLGVVSSCVANSTFMNVPLTGTVPAAWLWQRTDVNWGNYTKTVFAGCPADILAQVPKSWGGTKA